MKRYLWTKAIQLPNVIKTTPNHPHLLCSALKTHSPSCIHRAHGPIAVPTQRTIFSRHLNTNKPLCSSQPRHYSAVFSGRPRGVSPRPRRPGSASACAPWTGSSTPSAPHFRATDRAPRLWSDGTRRCRAKRRCCQRTSTLCSIRRRRATGRAFTSCPSGLVSANV